MDPLNLRNDPLPSLIGERKYKINDPTGESIYRNLDIVEEYITNQLNRPILWHTDEQGFVTLEFLFTVNVKQKYLPEQLPNLLSLYGAIYTFYDQNLTEEILMKIPDVETRNDNLDKFRNGEIRIRKFRDLYKNMVFSYMVKSYVDKGLYALRFLQF